MTTENRPSIQQISKDIAVNSTNLRIDMETSISAFGTMWHELNRFFPGGVPVTLTTETALLAVTAGLSLSAMAIAAYRMTKHARLSIRYEELNREPMTTGEFFRNMFLSASPKSN